MEKEVREVEALVRRLKEEDRDLRVFGADVHEYRFGPPLSEEELRVFERKHEIELPQDFRLWLQLVGNGGGESERAVYYDEGAGPYYGLYRLEVNDDWHSDLKYPFPFAQEETFDISLEKLKEMRKITKGLPGLLLIGTPGCSGDFYLVVNGQMRGSVLEIWEGRYCHPHTKTFLEWVREWAERAIPRVIRERVMNRVKLGMSKKQVVSLCSGNWIQSDCPMGNEKTHLRCEGFVSTFALDSSERVVRIIYHSI